MVVMKVKPVESCGNEGESLESTDALNTKPFATRNKATHDRLVGSQGSDVERIRSQGSDVDRNRSQGSDVDQNRSQGSNVERNEAPATLLHEHNTSHRSQKFISFIRTIIDQQCSLT